MTVADPPQEIWIVAFHDGSFVKTAYPTKEAAEAYADGYLKLQLCTDSSVIKYVRSENEA